MGVWPAAASRVATVNNELWRQWDEESAPTIEVTQTVPALIADIAVPALGDDTGDALAAAAEATARFQARTAVGGGLGHLSAVLIRADAVASSQIEHITTSSEHLAVRLADLDDTGPGRWPDGTDLVAANVDAALAAHRSRDPVSAGWFHGLHRRLLASDRDLTARHLGAWRDCAVWIGASRGAADFEGAPHQMVPELMDDLIRFSGRLDVHPVLHAAIAHAHFETIHPYVDGNGRVGRLLIHKLLGASPSPVPVAHGLLCDPAGYFSGLASYRQGDLDAWIGVFAAAIAAAAGAGTRLAARLEDLRGDYHRRVRTRRGSAVPAVIDMLFDNPAVTSGSIEDRLGVTSARAAQVLHWLADAQILCRSAFKAGRFTVWVASEVIDAVDTINATTPRRPPPAPDAAVADADAVIADSVQYPSNGR